MKNIDHFRKIFFNSQKCNYLSSIGMNVADDTEIFTNEEEWIMRFCDKFESDKQLWINGEATQQTLSEVIDEYRLTKIQSEIQSIHTKTRMKSNMAPNAGAWIRTIPKSPRLRLSPNEYRISCHLRYGWSIFDTNFDDKCIDCGEVIDKYGIHCLHCGQYGGWTRRHNAIRDCIFRWAQKAQVGVIKEKNGLLLENNRKPGDIFVDSYIDGVDYAFDVTVTSPYKSDVIKDSSRDILAAAEIACKDKYNKYWFDINNDNVNWKFQPLSFEATGGFDKPPILLIGKLADAISARYGIPSQIVRKSISDELSIIITRGSARLILRRLVEKEPLAV